MDFSYITDNFSDIEENYNTTEENADIEENYNATEENADIELEPRESEGILLVPANLRKQ